MMHAFTGDRVTDAILYLMGAAIVVLLGYVGWMLWGGWPW